MTILNVYVYVTNKKALQYVGYKQIDMQREKDKYIILTEHFNTPLSIICRFSKHKIRKDILRVP